MTRCAQIAFCIMFSGVLPGLVGGFRISGLGLQQRQSESSAMPQASRCSRTELFADQMADYWDSSSKKNNLLSLITGGAWDGSPDGSKKQSFWHQRKQQEESNHVEEAVNTLSSIFCRVFKALPDAQRADPVVASSNKCSTKSRQQPQALAVDGNWAAYIDRQGTGLVYYYNHRTRASRWSPPYASFPKVKQPVEPRPLASVGSWSSYLYNEDKKPEYNGFVYFYNHLTGESSWVKPYATFPDVLVGSNGNDHDMPQVLSTQGEWSAFDCQGHKSGRSCYFFNMITGESRWDPPTADFPVVDTLGGPTARDSTAAPKLPVQGFVDALLQSQQELAHFQEKLVGFHQSCQQQFEMLSERSSTWLQSLLQQEGVFQTGSIFYSSNKGQTMTE